MRLLSKRVKVMKGILAQYMVKGEMKLSPTLGGAQNGSTQQRDPGWEGRIESNDMSDEFVSRGVAERRRKKELPTERGPDRRLARRRGDHCRTD